VHRSAENGYCPEEPENSRLQSLKAVCDTIKTVITGKTMSSESHCGDGVIDFISLWLNRRSGRGMMKNCGRMPAFTSVR
jgi:hypothetical protein